MFQTPPQGAFDGAGDLLSRTPPEQRCDEQPVPPAQQQHEHEQQRQEKGDQNRVHGANEPASGLVNASRANMADGISVDSVHQCRMPPFCTVNTKYHLVVGALDPGAIQEVSDLLRNPPSQNKYNAIKTLMLSRLTDSADRQLQKVLNELELREKKSSQLLRQMRSLAGDRATEDVLRVRWHALLPTNTQKLLKIFRSTDLNEQAEAADQLHDTSSPPIDMAASYATSQVLPSAAGPMPIKWVIMDIKQALVLLIISRELVAL